MKNGKDKGITQKYSVVLTLGSHQSHQSKQRTFLFLTENLREEREENPSPLAGGAAKQGTELTQDGTGTWAAHTPSLPSLLSMSVAERG